MTLRRIARQILPPFITNALIRMMRGPGRGAPEWEYVPDGWRHREEMPPAGWNVESVVRTQRAKWDRFVALIDANGGTAPLAVYHEAATLTNDSLVAHNTFLSYGYVLARAAAARDATRDRLAILDWGSGLGHYFIVSRALLPDVTLDYHARDLPLLCEAGRATVPEITFHDNDADAFAARRYDLIVASGSLHYHEAWREILRGFAAASRRFVYITRLPIVHHATSFVVVQRPRAVGYETEYLGWFFNREEFLTGAREAGLRLVREFLVDERPHAHNAPEQCEFRGFLFEVG
jgi:putative methyltransferase (TIGR04325 family)